MHEARSQFVLLRHTRGDETHWDLGLDLGEALATWQILENPEAMAYTPEALPARRIGDHRRIYLEYEGPVSRDRGEVVRVDRGAWEALDVRADRWRFRLEGRVLNGIYVLERDAAGGDRWTFRRERHEPNGGAS